MPLDEITAELQASDLAREEPAPRDEPETVLPLVFAAKTDLGRVRENNEDKFDWWEPTDPLLLANRGRLYVVADGMGGHAAGQIAAEMALNTLGAAYYSGVRGTPEDALLRAITQANARVFDTAKTIPSRSGMGCTVVALAVVDDEAVVAWAGDSRAYLVRGGLATRMTRDHSLVAEQVQMGIITEEQAARHPQRNIITRSLGPEPSVSPEVVRYPLQDGDVVLLCSDGLTGVVSDEEIAEHGVSGPPSFACRSLIDLANARGGPDNVTVAIVHVEGEIQAPSEAAPAGGRAEKPRRRGLFRR